MKKLLVKIFGVAALTAVLTLSMSISSTQRSTDTNLMDLSTQSTANAECAESTISSANAKCLPLSQVCVGHDSLRDCYF